jgi:hypothetical protein
MNVGYGTQKQTQTVKLKDLGGGDGTWQMALQQLHGAGGVAISVPSTVQLGASGADSVDIQFTIDSSTRAGDYDGYILFTNGGRSLHIPYFVHVANLAVTPNSVLLVDDTASRFIQSPGATPTLSTDVKSYFEKALTAIGKQYTFWSVAAQGSPSLADMKRASDVIYFTGDNLNGYTRLNGDFQDLFGPLNSIDMMNLHQYLNGGGRVFITGLAAGLTDPLWTAFVLGGEPVGLSIYDSSQNDIGATGGISPPRPSAVVDSRSSNGLDIISGRRPTLANPWLLGGLKAIDLSTKGDGAGTNIATENLAVADLYPSQKLVGVTAVTPLSGSDSVFGSTYGRAILRTTNLNAATGSADIGIVNSDEAALNHVPSYKGRSVYLSFDFAGINDNTGYATRAEVMQRILQWLDGTPTAKVTRLRYPAHKSIQLTAMVSSDAGSRIVSYQWQVGSRTLKSTTKPTHYAFPRAGKFRIRAQVTDGIGHTAVTAWTVVTVR